MPKFSLTAEHDDGSTISLKFEQQYLPDVLMHIDMFLRGTGFVYDGFLGIDENQNETEEEKCGGDCSSCGCGSNSEPTPSVNRVETINISSTRCSICGLTNEQLGYHTCYDPKCPKVPKTFTVSGL